MRALSSCRACNQMEATLVVHEYMKIYVSVSVRVCLCVSVCVRMSFRPMGQGTRIFQLLLPRVFTCRFPHGLSSAVWARRAEQQPGRPPCARADNGPQETQDRARCGVRENVHVCLSTYTHTHKQHKFR